MSALGVVALTGLMVSGCSITSGATPSSNTGTIVSNGQSPKDAEYGALVYKVDGSHANAADDVKIEIAAIQGLPDTAVYTTSIVPWKHTGVAGTGAPEVSMIVTSYSDSDDAEVSCDVAYRGFSIRNVAHGAHAKVVCSGTFTGPIS
jgi:hypothetical protein